MENKYFTPSIEDIKVGYECEKEDLLKGWKTFIFDAKAIRDYMNCSMVDYQDDFFRVPYLTKEQLEAEGWDLLSEYQFSDKYVVKFQKIPEIGNPVILHFIDNNWIIVKKESLRKHELPCEYSGQCNNINTFKTIIKLLNI